MKRVLLILLAATSATYAQTTSITVMADTNRAVRTNFTIGNAQVTGLSALLDAKLATNGNASALTNITAANVVGTVATASNITGILAISNGGTGASSASNARTALGLGSAATNDAANFQSASAALTNLANGDGSGLTNISGSANPTGDGGSLTNIAATNIVGSVPVASGGTGGTNADSALASLLPAYTSNAGKVLAVATNETSVEWITAGGGGGSGTVTSVDASGGSTGMNFSGGPITTNGTLTLGGTLAIGSGGTGASDLTSARINLLPAYTNNAGKVLALNTNATDLEWVTVAKGVVQIDTGGTGATNAAGALINLGAINANNGVTLGPSSTTISGVAIGNSARAVSTNGTDGANGVAIGNNAYASTNGVTIGHNAGSVSGVAIGSGALTAANAIAIGRNTGAEPGIAIGDAALSYAAGAISIGDNAGTYQDGAIAIGRNSEGDGTNAVQIGAGTNTTSNTMQFLSAGTIDTNEWAALASSTAIGRQLMQAPTTSDALISLGIIQSNSTNINGVALGLNASIVTNTTAIAIGGGAQSTGSASTNGGIAIGFNARNNSAGIAIGRNATNNSTGVTIGHGARGNNSITIGPNALTVPNGSRAIAIGEEATITNVGVTNAIQFGAGTNTVANSIALFSWGNVTQDEWAALAASSDSGRYAMTNTAAISGSKTFVAYDGTNYTTNTVTFSNGIITGWTP